MKRGLILLSTVALLGMLVWLCRPANAFVEKMYTMKEVLAESSNIMVGRIESIDAQKRQATVIIDRALKGPQEFKKVLIDFSNGPPQHPQYLGDRLKVNDQIIIFYQRSGNTIASEVHSAETWFQLYANDEPANRDNVWWRMSHVEIRFNRTYNGATPKLIKQTEDVLANKMAPWAPDEKLPPYDVTLPAVRKIMPTSQQARMGGFFRQMHIRKAGGSEVRGICWTDINGDDRPDLLLCRQAGDVILTNMGEEFADQTTACGLAGGSRAAAWACDSEGHADLITANLQLFANVGGKLQNTSGLLPQLPERDLQTVGWIDFNGDGWPDIIVGNGRLGVRLFQNPGRPGAPFVDVSDQARLGAKGLGSGIAANYITVFDYDNDGLPDILINSGEGVLCRNAGNGTFVANARSGIRLAGPPEYVRGIAVADYDNDGCPDIFVPGPGKAQLYHNNNDGSFTDVINSSGDLARISDPSISAAWGDVNGDGNLDLLVCYQNAPPRLFLGDGHGKFTDVSERMGLTNMGVSACAASFADINDDGAPDLVVNMADKMVIAINEIPLARGRTNLNVRLSGNKGLTGAVVRVFDAHGQLLGRRELSGADGCGGQPCPIAHFGLAGGSSYLVTACLSDGRVCRKIATIGDKPAKLTFRGEEFK